MTLPQPQILDIYRTGLKGAATWMKASLESTERLQNQQLTAIRSALEAQIKSAAELGEAKSIDELLAVQARIAGAQMERVVAYWTSLYESQMSVFGHMQSQLQQSLSSTREAEAATMRASVSRARRQKSEAR